MNCAALICTATLPNEAPCRARATSYKSSSSQSNTISIRMWILLKVASSLNNALALLLAFTPALCMTFLRDSFYRNWLGSACWGFEPFRRELCLYAHAKETKLNKFLVEARKVRSNLWQWVKKGAINLTHHLLILDAEDSAIKGTEAKTKHCIQRQSTHPQEVDF